MSIIRVNKNKDYTVMSNFHLKDKRALEREIYKLQTHESSKEEIIDDLEKILEANN